ncbi:6226_t:CDS:2 [Dentiscutata heterogama]|uniref:6226_t:CDS:1 n=1 Tax=Dentiscutata heterogama TaxID=1316150 RepID=A0ACA9NRW7_9GLOM|nr:6226_t:CDS:2 [Dentiscutata heterogama]
MACFNPLVPLKKIFRKKDVKISKPKPTALPLIPPDFDDEETNTTEKVSKMLMKADDLILNHKYKEYVELLEQIVQMGSAKAAAKLGVVHHTGLMSIVPQDYAIACAYYFSALKFIYMISCNQWEMKLLLDIIAGLSDIYRFHMNRERDREIWDSGINAMEHIHQILQDPLCTKFLTHQDIQKRRAVRVHITYVLGLTAEADKDYSQALEYFTMCKRFGESGFATADKLVKKAQSKIKNLEPRVPRVKPICVECGHEPENKNELWGFLVCPKCLSAACCSSQCLQNHRNSKHEK